MDDVAHFEEVDLKLEAKSGVRFCSPFQNGLVKKRLGGARRPGSNHLGGVQFVRDLFQQGLDRQMAFMRLMNGNVRRIAVQPGARQAAPNNGAPAMAVLSPLPRNLHVLWLEWTNGIGGRKAARLFTPQERGAWTKQI